MFYSKVSIYYIQQSINVGVQTPYKELIILNLIEKFKR